MFVSRTALSSAIIASRSFSAVFSSSRCITTGNTTSRNGAVHVTKHLSSGLRWMSEATVDVPPAPTSSHPHTKLPGAHGSIIYTETDEAPALATYSLYPAVEKFGKLAGIDVIPCDISLAGRVLSLWPELLKPKQRVPDNLAYLGELAKLPTANIIKLPNISAPLNQLEDCIAELRAKGYDVPMYPRDPQTEEEQAVQDKYKSVMGSAVNPVLREGNSDRRVAPPVKAYAQKNPHRMGMWSRASRTHVSHMTKGDFYGSEQSTVMGNQPTTVRIQFTPKIGGSAPEVLKESIPLEAKEVIDASMMSAADLVAFYEDEIEDAKNAEILFSLHLKATMMKVSDPIMFGHCIRVYYKPAFDKHGATLDAIGANPNQGLASILEVVRAKCDDATANEILKDFEEVYDSEDRPWLAMVDSDKGITNLHAPNDIIIDASMPVVIRDSGKMWNKLGVSDNKWALTDCMLCPWWGVSLSHNTALLIFISFFLTPCPGNGGLQVCHPRSLLRYHVPGGDQLCQDQWTIRCIDHGKCCQCWIDGPQS